MPTAVAERPARVLMNRRRSSGARSDGPGHLEDELLQQLDATDSVIDWLNGALDDAVASPSEERQARDTQPLEKKLQQLSSFVSYATSEAQHETDAAMRRLRSTVPQLKFDLKLLRESTTALQSQARELKDAQQPALPASEAPAQTPLEHLSRLAQLKDRMSAARDVLRDAESWSTLEADVAAYLGEEKITEASLRLAEALSSLSVFERTDEYEQRRKLMQELTQKLEDSVQGKLVNAVQTRDLRACATLQEVLTRVGRADLFEKHWMETRRASLYSSWESARLGEGEAGKQSLLDYLPKFYNDLQALASEERIYAPTLFASAPAAYIRRLIAATLTQLQPSLSARLSQLAEQKADSALDALLQSWKATESFAVQISRLLAKIEPKADATAPTAATSPAEETDAKLLQDSHQWDFAVYEPFLQFQTDFRRLSMLLMLQKRRKEAEARISLRKSDESHLEPEELLTLGASALELAEESLETCVVFTKGFAAPLLLHSADDVIAAVINTFEERISLDQLSINMQSIKMDKDVQSAARLIKTCRQLFVQLRELEMN